MGHGKQLQAILLLAEDRTVVAVALNPTATGRWRDNSTGTSISLMAVSSVLTNMRQGQKEGPTSAVSAVKQVQQREALGRSVGGIQHQIHLRCDGNGTNHLQAHGGRTS